MRKKKVTQSGKVYDTDFIYKISESLSYRFFGPIFTKLPFTHIQITIMGFLIGGLASAYFFTLGTHRGYLIGLSFCIFYSILDWMDGFVAKSRGISSVLGAWLDPALDFIWQNLLIAGLVLGVYNSKNQAYLWLIIGILTLVNLVVANNLGIIFRDKFDFKFRSTLTDFRKEIQSNKKSDLLDFLGLEILAPTNFLSNFLFTVRYPLILGAILNIMDIVILLILITQTIRALSLFLIYSFYLNRKESNTKRIIIHALESREITLPN